jgi:cytochrome P450
VTDAVVADAAQGLPTLAEITTPAKGGGLLSGPGPLAAAAWIGVRLLGKPLRLGKLVIAARHRDVETVLGHDLDFGIAPVNEKRIDAVNGGPFVLGRDRSAALTQERRALYAALAAVEMAPLAEAARREADDLLAAAGNRVDVVGGYARRVAGHTASRLFGISGPDEALFPGSRPSHLRPHLPQPGRRQGHRRQGAEGRGADARLAGG